MASRASVGPAEPFASPLGALPGARGWPNAVFFDGVDACARGSIFPRSNCTGASALNLTDADFLELYEGGIGEKLAVSVELQDTSRLVTLLYSTNGPLNVVIELWRHDSLAKAEASRRASRKAATWRSAIEEIATISTSFEVEFLRPRPSAPWQ